MGFARNSVPFLAIVAIAVVIATPRASKAQIMDPGSPPRLGAVAISPSLESALPASSSHFDGFLAKGWGGHVVRSVPAYDKVFIPPVYWLWARRRGEI